MKRWEYNWFEHSTSIEDLKMPTPDTRTHENRMGVVNYLNGLGHEGWEVVHMFTHYNDQTREEKALFWCKRRIRK